MKLYLLFESPVGYALFLREEFEEINSLLAQVQKSVLQFKTFSKSVTLDSFFAFQTAEISLKQCQSISKGEISEELNDFLQQNLPLNKKSKFCLGIQENKLGANLASQYQIEVKQSSAINEIFRGIRVHFTSYLKNEDFNENDLEKASLGLAHAFSRSKVGQDLNRQDKHIIQSSALLELMDKNINQFSMRIKEWFGWHFPEMSKIVTDNEVYVKLVQLMKVKENLNEDMLASIEEITGDAEIAQNLLDSSKQSMGNELSQMDQESIEQLSEKLISHIEFKKSIQSYLKEKMDDVAPNLTTLVGENVAAKLISQAGSLMTLAKYPASTVQILGAEKALFRALKTRGNTPKYGLLFHSSYISRADTKNKGKISRYLANKCAIAARLDSFLVKPNSRFGEKLKEQVENRMKFVKGEMKGELETNEDVMGEVLRELRAEGVYYDSEAQINTKLKKQKKGKRKCQENEQDQKVEVVEVQVKEKKKKKNKKQSFELQQEKEQELLIQVKEKKKKKVKA